MLNKEAILQEIENAQNLDELEQIRKKYIWKKWLISAEFKTMKDLSPEEKKQKGQFLAELKSAVETALKNKQDELYKKQIEEKLAWEIVDITLTGVKHPLWTYGLLLGFRRYIEDVLQSMGFVIENWNEIVTKYQNFYSVNIPADHPAVEMQDTFYLEKTDKKWENLVLRTHTSSWQNQVMKKYGAPCKVMLPGKVFRYENTDASHDTTFWQLEWVVIDEKWKLSLANLIGFLEKFFSTVFGQAVKIRLRPAYFPFVEPGFEGDVSCPICNWKWCSLCKWTGWIEVFGAGMIHPNVLKEGGVLMKKSDDVRWWKINDSETEKIIWLAMDVHNQLWPQLRESIYQKALYEKLVSNWFDVEIEKKVEYKVDWKSVGYWMMDLVVNGNIALEIKSKKVVQGEDFKQIRTYMNQAGIDRWLLLNFYFNKMDIKRFDNTSSDLIRNNHQTSYIWFAFGLWITRIVAIKYWIKDIRLFNAGDLRFLGL